MRKPAFIDIFLTLLWLGTVITFFLALAKGEKPDFMTALVNAGSFTAFFSTLALYLDERRFSPSMR